MTTTLLGDLSTHDQITVIHSDYYCNCYEILFPSCFTFEKFHFNQSFLSICVKLSSSLRKHPLFILEMRQTLLYVYNKKKERNSVIKKKKFGLLAYRKSRKAPHCGRHDKDKVLSLIYNTFFQYFDNFSKYYKSANGWEIFRHAINLYGRRKSVSVAADLIGCAALLTGPTRFRSTTRCFFGDGADTRQPLQRGGNGYGVVNKGRRRLLSCRYKGRKKETPTYPSSINGIKSIIHYIQLTK